ncbi:MAG: 16S rRNA pseudouridine(516) synthase, partial [Oscillospiraceae bacterium]
GYKNVINFKSGETCKSSKLFFTEKSDTQSTARVFLKEGMYHQIKRMFKSYGLNVIELKRIRMGGLYLDENLQEGEVREILPHELEKIKEKTNDDF